MTIQIISSNVSTTAASDHAVDIAAQGDLVIVQAGVVVAASGALANGIDDGGLGGVGIEVSAFDLIAHLWNGVRRERWEVKVVDLADHLES